MICQALRISIFNSFHSVTRITYNVHKILQGVPKKWARSDPKWPRPSERTWMAQSGPKWPKIPASHHSPQNFKSTFFLGHPVPAYLRASSQSPSATHSTKINCLHFQNFLATIALTPVLYNSWNPLQQKRSGGQTSKGKLHKS